MPRHAEELDRDVALQRVIAVVNDKGGVGKTSISANLAGQFAAAGYRSLLVDMNRQANLADDLGFRGATADDQGKSLVNSLQYGTPPTPAREIRHNLDIICGGTHLEHLTTLMVTSVMTKGTAAYRILGDLLAPIAPDYDLVLIDCPPESPVLTDLALNAARWVLMPTKSDGAGLVGMSLVAQRFTKARENNPQLSLLGAVLFATGTNSKAIHTHVRTKIAEAFGGQSPLFTARVRHAERTALDARERGLLAHELEAELAAQPAWWQVLRDGKTSSTPRVSATAASVAGDYQELAVEVLSVLREAEEAAAAETGAS